MLLELTFIRIYIYSFNIENADLSGDRINLLKSGSRSRILQYRVNAFQYAPYNHVIQFDLNTLMDGLKILQALIANEIIYEYYKRNATYFIPDYICV